MSRIQFSSTIEEIIGKLAGSVFQDSYMGIQIRTRVSPQNPQSYFQQLRRGKFAYLTGGWRNLSPTDQGTWITEAGSINAGFRLYVGCNINLTLIGEDPVSAFTSSAVPDEMPLEISTYETNVIEVLATGALTSVPTDHRLLLFATAEKEATKIFTNPSQYSPIASFAAGTDFSTPVDITAEWIARYGQPTDDKRICIKSALVNITNGLRGDESINCALNPFTQFILPAGVSWCVSVRKIVTAYAGSCMRVRRTSDSTEMDIGFDGSGLLDVATLESFCSGTDGRVRTWYDQSGNGINWQQATAGTQPYICRSGATVLINGLPAVRQLGFEASPPVGKLGFTLTTTGANPSTMFQVALQSNSTPQGVSTNSGTILSDNNTEFVMLPTTGSGSANYSGSGTPSFWINGVSKTITTRGQAASEYFLTQPAPYVLRTCTMTNLNLSTYTAFETARFAGASIYGDHFIAERIMYYSDKASDRAYIENNQLSYFNI
jgi:hypothetical protein